MGDRVSHRQPHSLRRRHILRHLRFRREATLGRPASGRRSDHPKDSQNAAWQRFQPLRKVRAVAAHQQRDNRRHVGRKRKDDVVRCHDANGGSVGVSANPAGNGPDAGKGYLSQWRCSRSGSVRYSRLIPLRPDGGYFFPGQDPPFMGRFLNNDGHSVVCFVWLALLRVEWQPQSYYRPSYNGRVKIKRCIRCLGITMYHSPLNQIIHKRLGEDSGEGGSEQSNSGSVVSV